MKINKFLVIVLLVSFFSLLALFLINGKNVEIFNPAGAVALAERNLFILALMLAAIIVLPTFAVAGYIAWKYKARTEKETGEEVETNSTLIFVWWLIPTAIIIVLALITWQAAHALDPFKPLNSSVKPLTIQVVALRWKWLFIYPEQNIATVNFIQVPTNTPLDFNLTADAPMNSFWIPQLGGQIYAMAGMSTHLNLMANKTGEFRGQAAEINGAGFSGMNFKTKATSKADFDQWVATVKASPKTLNQNEYNKLTQPSENSPVTLYSSAESELFNNIMMKFMMPSDQMNIQGVSYQ